MSTLCVSSGNPVPARTGHGIQTTMTEWLIDEPRGVPRTGETDGYSSRQPRTTVAEWADELCIVHPMSGHI